MPFGVDDLMYGFVVPAIVAAVLLWTLRRWLPGDSVRPLVTVLTFVVGFQAGYWLLAWRLSLAPLRPASHWHWVPEALLLTVLVALPPLVKAERRIARLLAVALVATASAWVLVPTWDQLEPSRGVQIAVLVATVVIVTALLEPLAKRYTGPAFPAMLTCVMASGAVILALSGSLRFAQMAGCGVAVLSGITLATWFDKQQRTLEGIAFPVTLLISALMLIGRVNSFSEVPRISYELLPLAPLSLWVAVKGPLASTTGFRRALLLALPLMICAAAVGLAILPEFRQLSDG